MRVRIPNGVMRPFLIAAVSGGLLSGACGTLEKVGQEDPVGPSETGLSAQLIAFPDVLNADGVSEAVVEMVLRDSGGQPVVGRAVLFCTPAATPGAVTVPGQCEPSNNIGGSASLLPQAGYTYVGPIQSGIVMATDSNGVARVVWVAGTDHNTIIVIGVRTYGIDASSGFLQTVQIFQQ